MTSWLRSPTIIVSGDSPVRCGDSPMRRSVSAMTSALVGRPASWVSPQIVANRPASPRCSRMVTARRFQLAGGYGQPHVVPGQPVQQGLDPRVGLGAVGEALGHENPAIGADHPVGGVTDQRGKGPVEGRAEQGSLGVGRQRGHTLLGQRLAQGGQDRWSRVDQGAVQVEQDGVRAGMRGHVVRREVRRHAPHDTSRPARSRVKVWSNRSSAGRSRVGWRQLWPR